jgi:hypothetical protein
MESYEKAIRLFLMLHQDNPASTGARSDAATAFARMATILKAAGRVSGGLGVRQTISRDGEQPAVGKPAR